MPGDVVPEHLQKARLSDPWIAADQHDLALALLRPFPAAEQQRTFRLASHERRQPAQAGSLQATSRAGRLQHPVEGDGLRDAAERMGAALLHHEEPGHEAARRFADEDLVRPGELLYTRCQVHRFAEHLGVLPAALADHHVAGVDTDPDCQPGSVLLLETLVQRDECIEDGDASPCAALRAVVVGERVAEVREETVSEELGDVASEALDGLGAAAVIARTDRVPFLRV